MAKVEGRDNFGEDPKYFIGVEVERTPLFGMTTLFVIDKQNPKEILQRCLANNISHAYLGCGYTFNPETVEDWKDWDHIIQELFKADIWVTLDFNAKYCEKIIEFGWNKHNKFVAMISVPMPDVSQFNYNATLKIDDKAFKGSNGGVWCHQVHKLRDRSAYTDWSAYVGDKVID